MDLLQLLDRGMELAGRVPPHVRRKAQRDAQERRQLVAKARALLSEALTVDETRGWMSVLEQQPGVLRGLCSTLSTVAVARAADCDDGDAKVRVIRGALSAIQQCEAAGSVLTPDVLRSVAIAAATARETLDECTDEAIEQAAHFMHFMATRGAN